MRALLEIVGFVAAIFCALLAVAANRKSPRANRPDPYIFRVPRNDLPAPKPPAASRAAPLARAPVQGHRWPRTATEVEADLAVSSEALSPVRKEISAVRAQLLANREGDKTVEQTQLEALRTQRGVHQGRIRSLSKEAQARRTLDERRRAARAVDAQTHAPYARLSHTSGQTYYRNDAPPPLPEFAELHSDHADPVFVVGVKYHQSSLMKIIGGPRDGSVYFHTYALIYAEPENPHDPNAVAIDIDGLRVGYIRREDAEAFGAELRALKVSPVQCRAEINGGSAQHPTLIVKLDLSRPLSLI